MLGIGLDALIHLVLPTGRAAVEAVAEVILRELVLHAVQRELALVDAVRIPADGGAEVRLVVLREIVGDLVEAQDDILHLPILVRDHDGDDAAAEVRDAYLHAFRIGHRVKGGGLTVVGRFEILRVQTGNREVFLLAAGGEEGRCT